jgi:hypothetical protein
MPFGGMTHLTKVSRWPHGGGFARGLSLSAINTAVSIPPHRVPLQRLVSALSFVPYTNRRIQSTTKTAIKIAYTMANVRFGSSFSLVTTRSVRSGLGYIIPIGGRAVLLWGAIMRTKKTTLDPLIPLDALKSVVRGLAAVPKAKSEKPKPKKSASKKR